MKTRLSEYMDINRIEFIVTWQCGGKCKHCQIGKNINKRGTHRHVLADYAVQAVKQIAAVYDVTSVMTFGGEPLYYPEVTAAIHKAATENGITTRQIITNGHFTRDTKRSGNVAQMLADAGVNNLLLSVDAFHQEHIPLASVRQFARDLVDVKLEGAYIYPAWLVNEAHDNPYNAKTKEILATFSDIALPIKYCEHHITPTGQAAEFLGEYFDKADATLAESDFPNPCPELLNVTNISIVPNGDMMVCDYVIGNIYEENARDIIARYDPYGYPVCENRC
ncbi:MAG: radical SAM protein [Defluviitaleaceae bacterium]|nr:radical SAM protein [Defluviitaleaceae bacterium]